MTLHQQTSVPLAIIGVLIITAVAGCRPRAAAPPPPAPPPQARIGIVDFEAVIRAHPRWAELQQLEAAMRRVDAELAAAGTLPPGAPPAAVSPSGLKKTLEQEAAALKRRIEQELGAIRAESRRRLTVLATELQAEQQKKFQAASKQITDEAQAALDAKQEELQAKLRTGELAIMEEYSYPILNLRLRAEVAGLRSEDEARQILRQIQLLQSEREARVADLRETLGEEYETFQATKETEANDRLKALQESLNKELREQLAAKEAELAAQLAKTAAERQAQFQRQLTERQRQLISTAESQLRSQQRAVVSGLGEQIQRLQAQRLALLEQRQRLEDAILADVRIEVASLAAQQGIDTVLTRLVVNISGTDITAGVVQRLKQR